MGESSNTDTSNPNEMRSRDYAKAAKSKKEQERSVAFDQGGRGKNFPPEYKEKAGSGAYSKVSRNVKLAEDLEYKANNTNFMGKARGKNFTIFGKDLGFNMMDTSIAGKGLDAIQRSNYLGQAEKLRGGGKAVYGDKGSYQGVVSKNFFGANVYSGNADYSPIGRSQGASYDYRTGTYTSSAIQNSGNDGNDSQVSNNIPSGTQTSSIDKTDSTTTSLSTTAKRSLLANNQGGASTRYFMKT